MFKPWARRYHPKRKKGESRLLRYGLAMLLPMLAVLLILVRTGFTERPYFIFLAAVVLSAANGGLAAGFLTTATSALLIKLFFIEPRLTFSLRGDWTEIERMLGFVLVSLLLSSFVASLRRERNALRESEERHRLLAESASDAIMVVDEHGEILYANPVAERTFGNFPAPLLGKNIRELLPGDAYQSQLAQLHHEVDSRKAPVAVQLPGLHQSGQHLLIEMTLGSAIHRGRNLITAVMRNITAQRAA